SADRLCPVPARDSRASARRSRCTRSAICCWENHPEKTVSPTLPRARPQSLRWPAQIGGAKVHCAWRDVSIESGGSQFPVMLLDPFGAANVVVVRCGDNKFGGIGV